MVFFSSFISQASSTLPQVRQYLFKGQGRR